GWMGAPEGRGARVWRREVRRLHGPPARTAANRRSVVHGHRPGRPVRDNLCDLASIGGRKHRARPFPRPRHTPHTRLIRPPWLSPVLQGRWSVPYLAYRTRGMTYARAADVEPKMARLWPECSGVW